MHVDAHERAPSVAKKDLLKIEEVGELVGLSTRQVYRHIKSGRLRVIRFDKSVRVRVSDYQQWLDGLNGLGRIPD